VQSKHRVFRFVEDRQLMDRIVDAPLKP